MGYGEELRVAGSDLKEYKNLRLSLPAIWGFKDQTVLVIRMEGLLTFFVTSLTLMTCTAHVVQL